MINITKLRFEAILLATICMCTFRAGELKAQNKPTVKTYELLGENATPEGISIDQRNGNIYTGGMQDGSMQLTANGKSGYFIKPGQDVLLTNVLGSAVDEENNRIWVCSNDFSKTFNGTPTARVSVLSLRDGSVIKQFSEAEMASAEGVYPFVNDVVLDKSGNAYISNSASNTIFKVSGDLSGIQVLANKFPEPPAGKKYSLNGIEVSEDQKYLFSNSFVMTDQDAAALFRIDIKTGEVSLIHFEEKGTTDFSSTGGDGLLMLDKNTLLIMSVGSKLLKAELNKELTKAVLTNISSGTPAEEEMKGCATIASYKNKIYTTNAQGSTLFNPELTAQKPYKVIEIPEKILSL